MLPALGAPVAEGAGSFVRASRASRQDANARCGPSIEVSLRALVSLDASWIRFGRDHPRAIDPHHVSILPLSSLADENKPQPDFIIQAMLSSKVSTGIKAKATAAKASKAQGAVCFFGDAKKAAAATLAAAVLVAGPAMPARADLTSDLLARTEANKELNDKKRAATSSANFERSRTVTDGVCKFPQNMLGCEIASSTGDVAFLSADKALECEGTRDGKVCASKAPGSFPPVFGM